MKKISVIAAISLFLTCFFISLVFAQQSEERLTITTYYPSPYGSYRDLTVSRAQAIGDVNGDGRVDVDDLAMDADGTPMSGTLTVANRIGIGTISPAADLHISSHVDVAGIVDERAVLLLDARGSAGGQGSRWELVASAYRNPSSAAPAGNTLMLRKIEGGGTMNSFTQALIIDEDRHIYLGRSYNAGGAWAMPENATLTLGPRSDTDGARLHFTGGVNPGFYFDNSGGDMRFFTQDIVNNIVQPLINSTQRLTILNNGNVGIGTPAPEARLDIQSPGPGSMLLKAYTSSGDSNIIFYEQSVNNVMTLHMARSGGATSIMLNPEGDSFLSGGNVGIGTTPQAKLDVDGDTIIRGALNPTAFFKEWGPWTDETSNRESGSICPSEDSFVCGINVKTGPLGGIVALQARCCN